MQFTTKPRPALAPAEPPAWAYQPPKHPEAHPTQCYYRAGFWLTIAKDSAAAATAQFPDITVARAHVCDTDVDLALDIGAARIRVTLNPAALQSLRDALNDALADVHAVLAERDRVEAFQRIQEDLRLADELGGSHVYYAHPDVHYVPADQVQAKVAELEAAGAERYIVLADPACEGSAP